MSIAINKITVSLAICLVRVWIIGLRKSTVFISIKANFVWSNISENPIVECTKNKYPNANIKKIIDIVSCNCNSVNDPPKSEKKNTKSEAKTFITSIGSTVDNTKVVYLNLTVLSMKNNSTFTSIRQI